MATRPANQASGSGTTSKARVKAPKTYAWGTSKGHSIPLSEHVQNLAAKKGDGHPGTPGAPVDPLMQSAQTQAASYYQPQVDALTGLQNSVPQWVQNYIDRSRGAQANAATYAAPIVQRATDFATNVNTPAAGLDPSSPEYQRSQQAGKGLSALAQLGVENLQANEQANTNYFGGQQNLAAANLPQLLASYRQQQGQLGSQIAGKTQEIYQANRAQALSEWQAQQNVDIARQTLGANEANQSFDNALHAGINPLTGKPLPPSASDVKTQAEVDYFNAHGYWPATGPQKPATGYGAGAPGLNKYGFTSDQWNKLSPKARAKARAGNGTGSSGKDAAKHQGDIAKASGGVQTKVTDIIGKWDSYKSRRVKTGQTKKVNGQDVDITRPANPNDIRSWLVNEGVPAELIHIALLRRVGKTLDPAAVDYLHNLDPNIRIPRSWLPKAPNIKAGTGNPAASVGTGLG